MNSWVKNGKFENVGSCGIYVFCVFGYRVCYICLSFEFWIEVFYEEVFNEILVEREK